MIGQAGTASAFLLQVSLGASAGGRAARYSSGYMAQPFAFSVSSMGAAFRILLRVLVVAATTTAAAAQLPEPFRQTVKSADGGTVEITVPSGLEVRVTAARRNQEIVQQFLPADMFRWLHSLLPGMTPAESVFAMRAPIAGGPRVPERVATLGSRNGSHLLVTGSIEKDSVRYALALQEGRRMTVRLSLTQPGLRELLDAFGRAVAVAGSLSAVEPVVLQPPKLVRMFMPPMPIPERVRGHRLIVDFDVDADGKILSMKFNPTRDPAYNRILGRMFKAFEFEPAIAADGRTIRGRTTMVYEL